ncbi:MAG: TolC family protein [Cyanobacteria bacterium SZAS TMP-1]|nr:TolC family protein [Cyanobacteria bacterium SZAS TMP-1]
MSRFTASIAVWVMLCQFFAFAVPVGAQDLLPPITLHQAIEQNVLDRPVTIKAAVEYASQNYPNILKSQAQMRAAQKNVTVQKLNEYLPDSLLQYQEIMASHNKLSQIFYGSPVFPAVAGPGFNNVNMQPIFFSSGGFSLDWAPLDFGLHKARINMSKDQYAQARAQFATTQLDVCLAAANAFLDSVVAMEQLKAANENQASFDQFAQVVHAQVNASLKPGADASLADAQLANARNDVIRANLAYEIALANLANTLGLGGKSLQIDATGLATTAEPADMQKDVPLFETVPILQTARAALNTAKAQKRVLDKEYFPVFHFLGGVNMRGSGLDVRGRPSGQDVNGLFPLVPNYQVAMIINWNFLDIVRLRAEKKVQMERIEQQNQDFNLVLQNLKTQDVQSRARVKAALALAENMPVQVKAAYMAASQAAARYKTGLGSVAQVAEANQVLAQSRAQEAIARVGVWRALLAVAAVHGDIKPFLAEAERVQKERGL